MLKNFAETILIMPMLLGTVALSGWLIQRHSFWINLGFLALGLAGVSIGVALIIWATQLLHPRFERPQPVWQVPALAVSGVCLAMVYFAVALWVPAWTTITVINSSDQPVTELRSTSCLEEDQQIPKLGPRDSYRFKCIPKAEGSFEISWQQAGEHNRLSTGYLTPGHAQELIVELKGTHQRLGI